MSRLTELEATIAQLKTAVPAKAAIVRPTDQNATEDNRETTFKASEVRSDVQDSSGVKEPASLCPKCGSSHTTREGSGKLRKDGTRAIRVKCKTCSKLSMIG